MAREGDKWRVVRGDCLWNIAKAVYGNPYRWTEIADRNGVSRKTALIYPGQLFILPGITAGSGGGGGSSTPPAPAPSRQVTINWWALDAGTQRQMFCVWSYSRANTEGYEVEWWYDTGTGGWRIGSRQNVTDTQYGFSADESAKKVMIKIRPYSQKNSNNQFIWTDGEWVTREYDFSNNPPELPPDPSFDINNQNILEAEIENIQETINATAIEFAIYQDDTMKYKTGTANINSDARYVKFTCPVDPGHNYKIRCRAVRNGNIYSGWTDFTENISSLPVAPTTITTLRSQTISEQLNKQYGVFIEWNEVPSAKTYVIQYATTLESLDTELAGSIQTEEGKGPRYLMTGLELGHTYFFKVASVNEKGQSADWSEIKSTTLGTKPSAPTTYSNVNSCVVGEDLNLYWVHNSTDGSVESYARLNIEITDTRKPDLEPQIITKVIKNEKPEEDKNKTSVYKINTNDPDWALIGKGFIIKWKVQTAGVTSEYSEWSMEREVNVYDKPAITLDIKNNSGASITEVNSFPFYLSVLATPPEQIPISYYIEIVANQAYETVDEVGNVKMVSIGDKVYQKYYDPQSNSWKFLLELTPGNIDLENNISYTANVTLSMDSGLTAMSSMDFTVFFEDLFYDVYADILINKDTLEANIHPYCNEYQDNGDGTTTPVLVENCKLAVYRREYDGTFTEIANNINNEPNLYVTDPHPALDYARYRIVARTNDTGAISYADIPIVKIGEPSVVVQWAEKWSSFSVDESGSGSEEPSWSGSMIKIPYNITTSENRNVEVALVNYAGREHPVSYYGTHIGESSSWSMSVPREDKEMLYALRRLSRYRGDVYVREPSGTGYWANINVSFNLKYNDVAVPVTFNVTRVEGGI